MANSVLELRSVLARMVTGLGEWALLLAETISSFFRYGVRWADTIRQMYHVGVQSQTVTLITGGFTGMVFAAQTFFQFHKVRMDTAVGAVVSLAMCRELGPVLTALMVSGRVGASFAAELGTMRVTEQVDALRAMAKHPTDYLVLPRVAAMMTTLPLLTVEAIAVGILSGYLVAVHLLGVDGTYFLINMRKYTGLSDVLQGLIKAACFALCISTICCYKGLNCRSGAEGVGRATTEAVVVSSVTVLISNFFITMLLSHIPFFQP
ncbi:MAG: ABC transporter permease [Verrucomicrobiae bacterium]|nr:ABC transporter permease [Verrucomicrobiae bacterium]